ncbi:hypothetical protein [Massilia endophytica]|uniref:hypothetical protein n=1 Tax=Massilia endophytica TaxID=2899220 RepID=UPI001E2AEE42|nr:hypothetical protein [Massilia endophytica]UGQ49127.1 hypothetical protein LSQ66_11885 [Massilia endophytica]
MAVLENNEEERRDRLMARVVELGIGLQHSAGLPSAHRFFIRWRVPRPVVRRVMGQPAERRSCPAVSEY